MNANDISVEISWSPGRIVEPGDAVKNGEAALSIATRYQRGNAVEFNAHAVPQSDIEGFTDGLSIFDVIAYAIEPAHIAQQEARRALATAQAKRARKLAIRRPTLDECAAFMADADVIRGG